MLLTSPRQKTQTKTSKQKNKSQNKTKSRKSTGNLKIFFSVLRKITYYMCKTGTECRTKHLSFLCMFNWCTKCKHNILIGIGFHTYIYYIVFKSRLNIFVSSNT